MKKIILIQLFIFWVAGIMAQTAIYDSGGPLMPEQAAYDAIHYHLQLDISPEKKAIHGSMTMTAKVVHPTDKIVLDLDKLLSIDSCHLLNDDTKRHLTFDRQEGKVWIQLPRTFQAGEMAKVKVSYGGNPRVAPRAPWSGGFQWEKTPSGEHWIATSCQTQGADIWWPVKDHVSDEPDSMDLEIRVPSPLVVATNGVFIKTENHKEGDISYYWKIKNPINVYNVALNIAPYQKIQENFTSVSGDVFPIMFYVIPEDVEKGKAIFPEFIEHLQFFENLLGPYPFRSEKYGVAQTPHLGMEHQTIIAYGAKFNNSSMTGFDWGFDALHHHELAHEWWGNLVTCADWKDMWIHEGFGSYMQPLYAEKIMGEERYHQYMNRMRRFRNELPIAPRESTTAAQIYQAPIYAKGAWVLHTLRYLVGDELFFKMLKTMAYPNEDYEERIDGSQTRHVTTDDFLAICESIAEIELDWFFETYLRNPGLPKLFSKIVNNTLSLSWDNQVVDHFPMPVEVQIGKERKRYNIPREGLTITFKEGENPIVDPDNWLLYEIGTP